MSESNKVNEERRQFRGIPLFFKEDNMGLSGDDFEGRKTFVPDLGVVQLFGSRGFEYSEKDKGIVFIEHKLILDKAKRFDNQDLFDIGVTLRGSGVRPNILLECEILIPNANIVLRGKLDFGEDEVESNPEKKYYAIVQEWQLPPGNEEYFLFSARDSAFLSQLRFCFRSIS